MGGDNQRHQPAVDHRHSPPINAANRACCACRRQGAEKSSDDGISAETIRHSGKSIWEKWEVTRAGKTNLGNLRVFPAFTAPVADSAPSPVSASLSRLRSRCAEASAALSREPAAWAALFLCVTQVKNIFNARKGSSLASRQRQLALDLLASQLTLRPGIVLQFVRY